MDIISYILSKKYTDKAVQQAGSSVIDDEESSETTTYSSAKIDELIASIPSGGRLGGNTYSSISTPVTVTKVEEG